MESDAEYCRRRAKEEREAALKASHPAARQAHLDLASRFDELAESAIVRDQRLGLGLDHRTAA